MKRYLWCVYIYTYVYDVCDIYVCVCKTSDSSVVVNIRFLSVQVHGKVLLQENMMSWLLPLVDTPAAQVELLCLGAGCAHALQ